VRQDGGRRSWARSCVLLAALGTSIRSVGDSVRRGSPASWRLGALGARRFGHRVDPGTMGIGLIVRSAWPSASWRCRALGVRQLGDLVRSGCWC
jgi:hypothetical protein